MIEEEEEGGDYFPQNETKKHLDDIQEHWHESFEQLRTTYHLHDQPVNEWVTRLEDLKDSGFLTVVNKSQGIKDIWFKVDEKEWHLLVKRTLFMLR